VLVSKEFSDDNEGAARVWCDGESLSYAYNVAENRKCANLHEEPISTTFRLQRIVGTPCFRSVYRFLCGCYRTQRRFEEVYAGFQITQFSYVDNVELFQSEVDQL
jgi:hypothetical protein